MMPLPPSHRPSPFSFYADTCPKMTCPPMTPSTWDTMQFQNMAPVPSTPWHSTMTPSFYNGPQAMTTPAFSPSRYFSPNWTYFDRSIRNLEHELEVMKQNAERAFANNNPSSTELCSFPSRPTSLLEHYSFLNPIRIDIHGHRWLNCCFDLRTFKPEEIKVTLNTKERCIHVEAEHEVKDAKEHYVRRHYNRKFFIPADLKVELAKLEIKSYLTTEGLLYVEAPLPQLSDEETKNYVASKHAYGTHFGFGPLTTVSVPVKNV